MIVHYNEFLEPSYDLTPEETQELEETGYFYDDELKAGMMKVGDEYIFLEASTNYDGIKFNYNYGK